MKKLRTLSIVTVLVLITGCATQPIIKTVPEVDDSPSIAELEKSIEESRKATALRAKERARKRKLEEERFRIARNTWKVTSNIDSITDVGSTTYTLFNNHSINLRCDSDQAGVMLVLNSNDVVAASNSDVKLLLRVDDNKAHTYNGYMFRDSYKSAYVILSKTKAIRLINEIKSGNYTQGRIIGLSGHADQIVNTKLFGKNVDEFLTYCK